MCGYCDHPCKLRERNDVYGCRTVVWMRDASIQVRATRYSRKCGKTFRHPDADIKINFCPMCGRDLRSE